MIPYCDIHTHGLRPEDYILSIRSYEAHPSLLLPPGYCSVGIHPCSIQDGWGRSWEAMNELISHPSVVAVGEAGFDKRALAPLALQREVFALQARLAETVEKPLVIHCVKAWDELLQAKKEWKPHMPWIIHGFRGNGILATQLVKAGFILSFGLYFQPDAVRASWPTVTLAETDERAEKIEEVYLHLAESLDLRGEDFARQIRENVQVYFSI